MTSTPAPPRPGGGLLRAGPRRTFAFMAVGALAGLLMAGVGLFTAKGTSIRLLPPEDVALVNQRPLLMADFVSQVETVYGTPFGEATAAQKQKILADMIREELFVQRGLELDFPSSDPDTRNALVAAVEQQVVSDVTTTNPSDAELRGYYAAHRDAYASEGTMTVVDLLYPKSAAAALDALVRAGRPASDAAGGVDTRRTNGEEFYFAAKLHLGDALFSVARGLASGSSSPPVTQPDGLHVLVMKANAPPVPLAFEAARERVLTDYKHTAEVKLQAADERYLRGKADILIDKAYR